MLPLLKWIFALLDRLGVLEVAQAALDSQKEKNNREVDSAVEKTKTDPANLADLKRLTNELPDAESDSGKYHQS